MKRFVLVAVLALASCGGRGGSADDDVVSTDNVDPDVSVSLPSEQEWQDQYDQTEQFALTVVGMTEEQAIEAIEEAGFVARVIARDGEFFAVTEDYSVTRINLVIVDGDVTEATVG